MASGDNLWIGDLPSDIDEATVRAVFEGYGSIVSSRLIPPKSAGKNAAALVRFENAEDAKWVVENLNGNMPEGFETPVVVQFAKNPPGGPGGSSYGKAPTAGKGSWDKGSWDKGYGKGGYDYRPSPYSYAQPPPPAGAPPGKGGYKGPPSVSKGKASGRTFSNAGAGNMKGFIADLAKSGRLPGVGSRPDEHCVYIKNLPPDCTDLELYQLFSVFGAIAHKGVTAMQKDGFCLGVGFVDFQDPMSASAAVEVLNGTAMPDGTVISLNLKRSRKGKGPGGKGPPPNESQDQFQEWGDMNEMPQEEVMPYM